LEVGGLGGVSLSASALLAACGGNSKNNNSSNNNSAAAATQPAAHASASAATSSAVGSGTPVPSQAAADATRKRGGTLSVYSPSGDLQRLDFQQTISTPTQNAAAMVFCRLISWDASTPPNTYTMRPELADSWEVTQQQITFHLRKGVKWQNIAPLNGRELVANDVKYSLTRVGTNDPNFVWNYRVQPITSIETPDPYTVVLKLDNPSAVLLGDLAFGTGMGIVPHEIIEADGNLDKRWVGTGAFMLDRWDKGTMLRLVKNPDFFRSGLPHLDAVEIKVITDASAKLAAFLSGSVAYHELAGPQEVDQVKKIGAQLTRYASLTTSHKVFNVGSNGPPQFHDVRVRQAWDLAVDRDVLLQNVFGGDGYWGGPCIPSSFGDYGLSDGDVKTMYKQDQKQAKQLLTAAGVNTISLPVEYSNIDTVAADEAPLLQQMLSPIGISIDLKPVERTAYLQHEVDGSFQVQIIGSGAGNDPDSLLYAYYHSQGGKNWGRINDPELDKRINTERAMLDVQQRTAYIKQLAKDWQNYLYRQHTVYPNAYVAWQSTIKGAFVPKGADWQPMEGVSLG